MPAIENSDPLTPDQAQRLTEFARACKAATRIVALYPATHPAIRSGLQRVAAAGERLRGDANPTITVTPDAMLLDGKSAPKPDPALADLAALLHSHLVGALSLQGDLTTTAWHALLTILARSPGDVRAEGGIGRVWMAAGGGPIEIRQIDYSEVLRERSGGQRADWQKLIASYLEGDLTLDETSLEHLLEIARDLSRFKEFTEQLMEQASATAGTGHADGVGLRGKKEKVLQMLQALADHVARTNPEQLDRILHQIAGVLPQLTPDLVVMLITTGVPIGPGGERGGIDLPGEVRARMSDNTIAEFVAQSVSRDQGASSRLAQAFQALVSEDRRGQLLGLAQEELAGMPLGQQPEFPKLWKSAENLLTTYSDTSFVSEEYAKELSTARSHAIEVEKVGDDPPERIVSWLATVSEPEVRRLDQEMLLDLLQVEIRPDAWSKVLDTVLAFINQLVLAGQVATAQDMLDAVAAAEAEGQPFTAIARDGLTRLRSGPIMKQVVVFIRQAQDKEVKQISNFCRTLGPTVIGPLAEALAAEQNKATVRRLREIVLSFGAAGRAYADELRTSANPAVRRMAVELLSAFGGADAVTDLAALLDDTEAAVQREALRAIVQIGTNAAYETLARALKTGTPRTRDAIMQVLGSSRDERAAPLFIYILDHTDHRGKLEAVYVSAIDALGKVGADAESAAALRKVLYQGEWWAPFRTARLRAAAASALRASDSEAAKKVLEDAAGAGPRGVRRAARAALAGPARRTPVRRVS